MKRSWKRALTIAMACLFVMCLSMFCKLEYSFADDLDPDPIYTMPEEDPHPDQAHTYDDGVCTLCGKTVSWDTHYVDENERGIHLWCVPNGTDVSGMGLEELKAIATELDDAHMQQVAITGSLLRTDDPSYRFDTSMSAMNVQILTLNSTDVIIDKMAEYTAKYETLSFTQRMSEEHTPELVDIAGGAAFMTLLSELDP